MILTIVAVFVLNLSLALFSVVFHLRAVRKIDRYVESLRLRAAMKVEHAEVLDREISVMEYARRWNRGVATLSGFVAIVNVTMIVISIVRAVL